MPFHTATLFSAAPRLTKLESISWMRLARRVLPNRAGSVRERIANVFRVRRPALSQEQAYRVASVSLQIIKSMNTLYTGTKPQERLEIAKENKLALTAYLEKPFDFIEKSTDPGC